jgi:chemotaxis protein methyltransferase CheR
MSSSESPRPLFPEREFAFGQREFNAIADVLRGDTGITLSDIKAPLVYSRLVKRLRALGLSNFKEYCDLIAEDTGGERVHMIAALTTNVTRFFREPHHFEHFKTHLLSDLVKEARRGRSVRIWSAGCSSGEEPYSIALTILDLAPDAHRHDVRVLATDIDTEILRNARQGAYSAAAVAPIPPLLRQRWMREASSPAGEPMWRAGEEMRALVSYRTLNLLGDWPMKRKFDAVFCRNVVIYFEELVREALWPRFAAAMSPHAFLYLGHSERVADPDGAFTIAGMTTYALRERFTRQRSPKETL